jgi:hypothetical protein
MAGLVMFNVSERLGAPSVP